MSTPYINIGTEKSCLFVHMSEYLLRMLERYPLLYYAVEESLRCAGLGYFCTGILTFSQILKFFKVKTPPARHEVAHEVLLKRPNKENYDEILQKFMQVTEEKYLEELLGVGDSIKYNDDLFEKWKMFMCKLHGPEIFTEK